MGYDNDPYRDEDGEALMDYDDFGKESPQPQDGGLLDDELDEDLMVRSRSPTPVHDSGNGGRMRKRLVKKGDKGGSSGGDVIPEYAEELEDEGVGGDYEDEGFVDERRKMKGKEDGGRKMKRKLEKSAMSSGGKSGKSRMGKGYSGKERDVGVNEMWDALGAGGSEDDDNGVRTVDDDNFIDDSGVDPADRYGGDYEQHSPSRAPQAEEGEDDEELKDLFKMGKKRKKNEKSPAEIALLVENVMAELEVTAEEDAELNRQGKPAITKLRKLPLLTDVLSKKQLQQEFLDHGVLTLLKNWLEPLPDGSLPNAVIREAILKILTDFPIDLDQYDRREQLKKSGLGKVIMFLSKSDEETTSNRKLAKELVDKWSRPIFNKSTRFEDIRNVEDERIPYRRPMAKKPVNKSSVDSGDGDDVDEFSRERKSGPSSSRQHASRPEATLMDFVVRPQSKIDPDEIRARAKQAVQDQRRMKMNKKLQQLKAPKKKRLQATKISVEGRGMVKYM